MKLIRPRCYFDVEISDIPLGRIVFELYSDICPITCENFRALCTGEKGIGKTTGKNLHYLNIVFHRVVKGFMIQSGDFSVGNGTGGESIYGGTFEDENFELKHDEPFLLSMANRGKDTNGSQFFMVHVVFGHVVSGQNVVSHIENLPVDKMSRPLQDVRVVKCNELVLKSKLKAKEKRKASPTSASSDESDKEEEEEKEEGEQTDSEKEAKKRKKHKKDKKKRKKKSKKRSGSSDSSDNAGSGSDTSAPPKNFNPITGTVSKINPAEIPDVPANKFLARGSASGRDERRNESRRSGPRKRDNIRGYTKSGRVIKGRGVFRYRTPSRSRSRSFTPPHWKQAETRTIKLSEFQKLEQEKKQKEEEIRRREEARKRRHEERDQELRVKIDERKNKDEQEKGGEEDGAPAAKPQRLRRTQVSSAVTNRQGGSDIAHDKPAPEETGPVDYNALDYDDEADPEDPRDSHPAKSSQALAKSSGVAENRSDQIVATMLATLEGLNKEANGRRNEASNTLGKGDTDGQSKPPHLAHSPSPETRRRELEAVLRAKLLLKKQLELDGKAKSRSRSKENVRRRRRTISRTSLEKRKSTAKEGEAKKRPASRSASREKTAKRNRSPGETKDTADKADKADPVTSTADKTSPRPDSKRSPSREQTLDKKSGKAEKKATSNRSRDKFKTTRKHSRSRSASRDRRGRLDRSKDRRARSRDRSRRHRSASRSVERRRGRDERRKRRRSSSDDRKRRRRSGSRKRSGSRDRKRSRSRDRKRSGSKDRKRSGSRDRRRSRDRKAGKRRDSRSRSDAERRKSPDSESALKEKRSEEARRKLTERLRELERAREARLKQKKRRSASSSVSSSDSSSSGSD
ncbi:hypothetical protein M8J75_005462 [Diaphorina citri]|nr:hypothetical protein M8J75_005462 [Diaphorina citri]